MGLDRLEAAELSPKFHTYPVAPAAVLEKLTVNGAVQADVALAVIEKLIGGVTLIKLTCVTESLQGP